MSSINAKPIPVLRPPRINALLSSFTNLSLVPGQNYIHSPLQSSSSTTGNLGSNCMSRSYSDFECKTPSVNSFETGSLNDCSKIGDISSTLSRTSSCSQLFTTQNSRNHNSVPTTNGKDYWSQSTGAYLKNLEWMMHVKVKQQNQGNIPQSQEGNMQYAATPYHGASQFPSNPIGIRHPTLIASAHMPLFVPQLFCVLPPPCSHGTNPLPVYFVSSVGAGMPFQQAIPVRPTGSTDVNMRYQERSNYGADNGTLINNQWGSAADAEVVRKVEYDVMSLQDSSSTPDESENDSHDSEEDSGVWMLDWPDSNNAPPRPPINVVKVCKSRWRDLFPKGRSHHAKRFHKDNSNTICYPPIDWLDSSCDENESDVQVIINNKSVNSEVRLYSNANINLLRAVPADSRREEDITASDNSFTFQSSTVTTTLACIKDSISPGKAWFEGEEESREDYYNFGLSELAYAEFYKMRTHGALKNVGT